MAGAEKPVYVTSNSAVGVSNPSASAVEGRGARAVSDVGALVARVSTLRPANAVTNGARAALTAEIGTSRAIAKLAKRSEALSRRRFFIRERIARAARGCPLPDRPGVDSSDG